MSAGSLMASILVSGVGYVLFSYGKKQQRLPQMLGGVALLAYPYFVSNVLLMLVVALGLLFGTWAWVKLGG